ncbi:hypothetical protein LINPERPRIM_LOCUS40989 [Linum perenne]
MVESRRRAEREAEYAARNSEPLNNFEYSDVVNKVDAQWWDTIAILCRHSLTIMHMIAMFGNEKFKTLDQRYIKDRWTRAGNEQTPPAQSRIGKTVATKFPKQPKPSKNSKRMKGIVELSCIKERNKFKRKRSKEAAIERAAEASRLQDNLAAIFDNNETVTSFPSFTELLVSQESVNMRF